MNKESDNESIYSTNQDSESETESFLLPKVSIFRIITYLFWANLSTTMIIKQIFNFIKDTLENLIPFVEGNMINSITFDKDIDKLFYYGKFMIMIIITKYSLIKISVKFLEKVDLFEKTKEVLYKNILSKDMEFFDKIKPSKIQTIFYEEIDGISSYMPYYIVSLIRKIITFIISFITLFYISHELFFIQLISFSYEMYRTIRSKNFSTDDYNKLYDDKNEAFSESIQNIKLIKTFSTEKKHFGIYQSLTKKIMEKDYEYNNLQNFSESDCFASIVQSIQLLYAGNIIISGDFGLGDFTRFKLISEKLIVNAEYIFKVINEYNKNYEKANRIFQLIDYVPKIKTDLDKKKTENIDLLEGNIKFENITFKYPTRPKVTVLKNLSFEINKGEIVAFVGSSGSGKSTISALLHRLYDPLEGNIHIGNSNIKDLDLEFFHSKIGYVAQEPTLFSMTVRENIIYGVYKDNLNEEEKKNLEKKLKNIMSKSSCTFIFDKKIFPDGLDTQISGCNLSGGQKQRIAIARALMKDVKILIFDEATSALDAESESDVQLAIQKIIKEFGITTIIIAHRLSTIKNCDKIFVLKNGEIVEVGNHNDLLMKKGFYKQLVDKQIEKENKKFSKKKNSKKKN